MPDLLLPLLLLMAAGPGRTDPPDPPPGAQLRKHGVVLHRGSAGAFDAGMVESPVVWYDENRKQYGMVYTGYALVDATKRGYGSVSRPQVGLAWSDDLLTWRKDPRSPIFGPSDTPGTPDSHGTTGPFIWHEEGTYYLYYFGLTAPGYEKGLKTMNLATSDDLISWKRFEGNPVIAPAGDGWRKDAIWHPNIVKSNGVYYMFFNASGVNGGLHEEFIGYATSRDLFHWTVDDDHSPVVVGSHTTGAWDASGRAGDPSLYFVDGIWYMAYYSWDKKNSADGIAWTTEQEFPLHWRIYQHNPVLSVGPPESFDALHAGKPFIVNTPAAHYHFYTAVDSAETREIALALWPSHD